LSQILEPGPIPQRFYLSPRACAGILRRAEKRGKELPAMLRQALESVAHSGGGRVSGPVEVGACLTANGGGQAMDFEVETFLVEAAQDIADTLTSNGDAHSGYRDEKGLIAHALRGEGFDASEDGTGRGTPIVPVAFPERLSGTQYASSGDVSPSLQALNPTAVAYAIQERAVSENPDHGPDGMGVREGVAYTLEARENVQAVAYDLRGREGGAQFEGPHETANLRAASGGSSRSYVATRWAVRRLTPTECERLQGFQDGHTAIPWRGKPADQCPDGPRYKALGNSMAVPCMQWIGRRLDAELTKVTA
jgi:DNA (cytosine-5)-methyltransferase 1